MNRSNIWIHLGLAIVLVVTAAVLGQIRRWQSKPLIDLHVPEVASQKPVVEPRSSDASRPEVMIRFKPGTPQSEIKRIIALNNDRIEDSIEAISGLVSVDDLDNDDAENVAAHYQQYDEVAYAEPISNIYLDERSVSVAKTTDPIDKVQLPNDPEFVEQWSLNNTGANGGKEGADIDALEAWTVTKGSSEVVIAVLDSGVDYNHPDLVANMWSRPNNIPQYIDDQLGTFNDINGFNAELNAADPMDQIGHGTHCAGVIGAEGDNNVGIAGINWNVRIMPLKFMGRGGFGTTKDAVEAINYVIDRKQKGVNVRVINASWGSTLRSKALEDAIRAAGENGILFVAASGNASANNDKRPHYPASYDLPNLISVASLDHNDSLSTFSNFGPMSVHIAAPGRDIVSTWLNQGFRAVSGTSMAAPHVSGVAGLILSVEPDIDVNDLKARILRSYDKIDSLSGKLVSPGRINAAKALEK